MNFDPLKSLWQAQPASMEVGELIKQAKRRQKRMLLLMVFDFVVWLGGVVWACFMIRANQRPDSLAIGIFLIIAISLATAYMLWLRTTTWGAGELDGKSLLKLSIHRCEAGIQLVYVTYIFTFITFIGFIVLEMYFPSSTAKFSRVIIWYSGYSLGTLVLGQWYRNRQLKKKQHLQDLLAELEQDSS